MKQNISLYYETKKKKDKLKLMKHEEQFAGPPSLLYLPRNVHCLRFFVCFDGSIVVSFSGELFELSNF
jgi:hypothetical protein